MEGVYYNITRQFLGVLKFYDDGLVLGVSTIIKKSKNLSIVLSWLEREVINPGIGRGFYIIYDNNIMFELESGVGVVVYNGKLNNKNDLILKSESLINGNRTICRYIPTTRKYVYNHRGTRTKIQDALFQSPSIYYFKFFGKKLHRNLRYFSELTGAGIIHCNYCGHNEKVLALFHGFGNERWTIKGYQCQACGKFQGFDSRKEGNSNEKVCECGGMFTRDNSLYCPKCRSSQVQYEYEIAN